MKKDGSGPGEAPVAKSKPIPWYRTKLPTEVRRTVLKKSNFLGFLQAGGHLAAMAATGMAAFLAADAGAWWAFAGLTFLHGMVCAFSINAVHELVHGTVFRQRWLNDVFAYPFAFIGWINHKHFWQSHTEHHKYTLHDPDDQEVVLPIQIAIRDFFRTGFIDPKGFWRHIWRAVRGSFGKYDGDWMNQVLGEGDTPARRAVIRWDRTLVLGHGLVLVVSLATGYWWVPVLVSATPLYGKWLFFLCNNAQHVGLVDDVPDFRLCCRTIKLDPVSQFLYWHMNYHTEHHMYASVPCYRLGALHGAVRHDLPRPKGLIGCWLEIGTIMARQRKDPDYQFYQELPETANPPRLGEKVPPPEGESARR